MNRRIVLILALIISVSLSIMPSLAVEVDKEEPDPEIIERIDRIENEINIMENDYLHQMQLELLRMTPYGCNGDATENIDKVSVFKAISSINQEKRDEILLNYKALINKKTDSILRKNGFVPLDKDNNVVSIKSTSADIVIQEDTIYKDSSTNLYRYSGVWNFVDGTNHGWDTLVDCEDIAGVRLTNASGFQIYSSFCKTFDQFSTQTGYVDQYGQHSPTNSYCTKRHEDANGVAYNIRDTYINGAGLVFYKTDQGRITQYIKRTNATATTKVFLDYNHNYKLHTWNVGAAISSVNFSAPSHALNVVYSIVNQEWQRCSGGQLINF